VNKIVLNEEGIYSTEETKILRQIKQLVRNDKWKYYRVDMLGFLQLGEYLYSKRQDSSPLEVSQDSKGSDCSGSGGINDL
jgi:hypothetical protein